MSPRHRPPPRWNLVAASAPFGGFLGGLTAAMASPHFRWFEWGFRAWLPFAVGGTLCAGVALARAERLWGVTAAGLVVNTALASSWCTPSGPGEGYAGGRPLGRGINPREAYRHAPRSIPIALFDAQFVKDLLP